MKVMWCTKSKCYIDLINTIYFSIGVVFEHVQVESNVVRLTMNLSRDATVDEGLWEEKPLGETTEQVYNSAENMPHSGQCNSTTAICTTPPVSQY